MKKLQFNLVRFPDAGSALSGSTEAAQQRATLSMGLVAGTTVMLLTLVWGMSVILGSYDLSIINTVTTTSADHGKPLKGTIGSSSSLLVLSFLKCINMIKSWLFRLSGVGVVTDVETSYTARIMLITLIPLCVLLLAGFFGQSGKRVVMLIALIITVLLLIGFMLYQVMYIVYYFRITNSLLALGCSSIY